MRFLVILFSILFYGLAAFCQDEVLSGLFFASHDVIQEKRTSLILTSSGACKYPESFSLEMEANFRRGDGYYGCIFRVIGDEHTNIDWCKSNKIDYVPLVSTGFSCRNINGPKATQISYNKGSFLWKQVVASMEAGAEMLYVAMFDEIDEGTAIYKVTNNFPVGASAFVTYEGLSSDFYMRLVVETGKWIHGKKGYGAELPLKIKYTNIV